MKSVLKQVIFDQQQIVTAKISRYVPAALIDSTEILVISGIRRCGKSTLLHQIRQQRAEKDFYLNFDDERLLNFKLEDFQLLHELFIELFGEQHSFYFDEIQNITGWERFVRRLYDAGNKVFVTGSNASMLSRELGTHLTGRFCQFELYPFSFKEFLIYKGIDLSAKYLYSTVGKATLNRELDLYLAQGGFPQYVAGASVEYLKSLYESILYRDVMVRNKLTNEREMLELVYYLASNVSCLSSYNSLTAVCGVKNSTTIKNYIGFLEDSYLLFQLSKYDFAVKNQIRNPKKTYFIDSALVQRLGFNFSANLGRVFENVVFLELKRRAYELFYHSEKQECDFVLRKDGQIVGAMQVCVDMREEKTRQREINGLIEALALYNLTEGIIVTLDQDESVIVEGKKIQLVPFVRWVLEM